MDAIARRRAEAAIRLPTSYALALRLRDEGMTSHDIATSLGIDPVSVGPLLMLAEAKLESILNTLETPPAVDHDDGWRRGYDQRGWSQLGG